MVKGKKLELTGRQKAAVLLIFLGPDVSSDIFKQLSDDEIEMLTLEIARMQTVNSETTNQVIEEFNSMLKAQKYLSSGGISYARDVLEKALGSKKAAEILSKLTSSFPVRPFEIVRATEPSQLINFIQNEHPQVIALILAYLQPEKAAVVLASLPEEVQADVTKRLAVMDRTSPEVIREVERLLEKKLSSILPEDYTSVGGIDSTVEILNKVDRGTENTIIEALEVQDPELAEEIKKRMFVFEDVVSIDDRGIQRVLREIDMRELAVALKGTNDDVLEKFRNNMSKRATAMLQEDMEYMGPVRVRDVEEAQQKIVNVIRSLEETGEIIIARGSEEELVS
ncbi:MAG: flagellar motor switch protein FliG [Candidatus Wallbacteria bacterium]|nr:flagellar motor switch protein FliG [Candidatus Wallbacteria bacterium]